MLYYYKRYVRNLARRSLQITNLNELTVEFLVTFIHL